MIVNQNISVCCDNGFLEYGYSSDGDGLTFQVGYMDEAYVRHFTVFNEEVGKYLSKWVINGNIVLDYPTYQVINCSDTVFVDYSDRDTVTHYVTDGVDGVGDGITREFILVLIACSVGVVFVILLLLFSVIRVNQKKYFDDSYEEKEKSISSSNMEMSLESES